MLTCCHRSAHRNEQTLACRLATRPRHATNEAPLGEGHLHSYRPALRQIRHRAHIISQSRTHTHERAASDHSPGITGRTRPSNASTNSPLGTAGPLVWRPLLLHSMRIRGWRLAPATSPARPCGARAQRLPPRRRRRAPPIAARSRSCACARLTWRRRPRRRPSCPPGWPRCPRRASPASCGRCWRT